MFVELLHALDVGNVTPKLSATVPIDTAIAAREASRRDFRVCGSHFAAFLVTDKRTIDYPRDIPM